jgi:signal transduction histidine kinase
MQDGEIEFDSEELDDLTFEWRDIRQLRSAHVLDALFADGRKLKGLVTVTPGDIVVGGAEPGTFPRDRILSLTPGGSGLRYWSGKGSLGLTRRSGNTDQVEDIRSDDHRADEVIDRMRSFMKRREFELRHLDLNLLASEVSTLVRPDSELRHVRLALETGPALPPVLGDQVQLQQVLLNLLLNAMDALNSNPPERRLITVRARTEGAPVEVAVSDTGHGIPADLLPRVFEPFFTSKPTGLGMGLAISRSIVEAHGGRLWAENNPDGGATFAFSLPVAGESQ